MTFWAQLIWWFDIKWIHLTYETDLFFGGPGTAGRKMTNFGPNKSGWKIMQAEQLMFSPKFQHLAISKLQNHWIHCISSWQLKYFFWIFTPKIGEMIQFDEHLFQMGWFNHQLDSDRLPFSDMNWVDVIPKSGGNTLFVHWISLVILCFLDFDIDEICSQKHGSTDPGLTATLQDDSGKELGSLQEAAQQANQQLAAFYAETQEQLERNKIINAHNAWFLRETWFFLPLIPKKSYYTYIYIFIYSYMVLLVIL